MEVAKRMVPIVAILGVARDMAADVMLRTIIGLVVMRLAFPTRNGKVPTTMEFGDEQITLYGIAQISPPRTVDMLDAHGGGGWESWKNWGRDFTI